MFVAQCEILEAVFRLLSASPCKVHSVVCPLSAGHCPCRQVCPSSEDVCERICEVRVVLLQDGSAGGEVSSAVGEDCKWC